MHTQISAVAKAWAEFGLEIQGGGVEHGERGSASL